MTESIATGTAQPNDPESRARSRLRREKVFYIHVAVYLTVIGGLFVINAINGRPWWFFWPALGWGVGILAHAIATFGIGNFLGEDWERRRLRELVDEERARR